MRRASDAGPFRPVQVEECDLAGDLAPLEPRPGYGMARVLVRFHSRPCGLVDVELPIDAAALRTAIEERLGPAAAAPRAALADPPFASVVVPTRDKPGELRRCLDAVLALEYPADRFEVIVADNAPSDARTRTLVDGFGDRVRYVHSPRPGSASARNDGAAAARGEIVAFIDDDARADPVWLAELVAGFRAVPEASCVTGLVLAAELDTPAQLLFEEYGGFGKGFEPAVYDLGAHRPDDPLFPYAPGLLGSGNNVAFRRAALLEIGGYDPLLGNGTPTRSAEDWELFLRMLRAGHTVAYRPSAIVWHTHRRDYGELRDQIADYGVGLSAALTRTVLHDPRAAAEIARRLGRGAWFLLSGRSPKNRAQGEGYPRDLRLAELAGLLRGPLAYARSRRRAG